MPVIDRDPKMIRIRGHHVAVIEAYDPGANTWCWLSRCARDLMSPLPFGRQRARRIIILKELPKTGTDYLRTLVDWDGGQGVFYLSDLLPYCDVYDSEDNRPVGTTTPIVDCARNGGKTNT